MVRIRKLAVAVGMVLLLGTAPAGAHEDLKSTVLLEVRGDDVTGRLEVPLDYVKIAVNADISTSSGVLIEEHGDRVRAYLVEHTKVTGDDGAPWRVELGQLGVLVRDEVAYLEVPLTLTPADGPVSGFDFAHDAFLELYASHQTIVSARPEGGELRVAGVLGGNTTSVHLDATGHGEAGFWTMVHHGFDHVGDGADHLLFLLVLLLPAPLIASAGQWAPGASGWRTLRQVVHVVTAFTLGHSVTLVASALDWVEVPSQPVEILIAVSVGAGAVHAIRPLIGHRESVIAAVFGLVHGLAFAGILDDLGLAGSTAVGALFGFNVGIELAQLAAVALVFPSLFAMSRTRWYPIVRISGAGVALVAASAWVADRASWVANPLEGIEEAAVDNPIAIAGALAVLAAATILSERRGALGATAAD